MPPKSNPMEELYTTICNAASTTAYTPLTYTTNNCTIASYPSVNMLYGPSAASEEIKEYTTKTDAHIDHLEEDIEFLNEERKYLVEELKKKDNDINNLLSRLDDAENKIISLEKAYTTIESEVAYIMSQIATQMKLK